VAGAFALHADFRAAIVRIGAAREPVIVVDNLIADPAALVEHAAGGAFAPVTAGFYPGVRAGLPPAYSEAVRAGLGALIGAAFGPAGGAFQVIDGNFSLTTTPPAAMSAMQRLPHIDAANPGLIAVLHYLCAPRFGGTAFYRHRATGLECVATPEQSRALMAAIARELVQYGEPAPSYVDAAPAMFERIATFDAAFNRAIIYRGAVLHSGALAADYDFSAGARDGRLTANIFGDVRATPAPWSSLAGKGR
jgi:Family of unknown function (DUF6445)